MRPYMTFMGFEEVFQTPASLFPYRCDFEKQIIYIDGMGTLKRSEEMLSRAVERQRNKKGWRLSW